MALRSDEWNYIYVWYRTFPAKTDMRRKNTKDEEATLGISIKKIVVVLERSTAWT